MNIKLFDRLRSHAIILPTGCWEWTGAKNKAGYANTWLDGKYTNAHRAMYIALYDSIPDDTCVCHSCDNPACINPDHLFLGTQKDNLLDMRSKNRYSHGEIHAISIKRGWTPEKRERRAKQAHERMQKVHALLTSDAGVPNEWKFCPMCNTWMPRERFSSNKARYDGRGNYCKKCSYAKQVAQRKKSTN